MDWEKYLHGECHIFALALHLEFGYPIQLAIDAFDLEIESERLIHAYCIKDDKAVDVRGLVNIGEILDDFDYNEPYHMNVNKEGLLKLIKDGFLHEPEENQLEEVISFIRNNKNKYQ